METLLALLVVDSLFKVAYMMVINQKPIFPLDKLPITTWTDQA